MIDDNLYTIRTGDSFWSLENRWGIPYGTLQKLNPKLDPRKLKVGQKIKIPIINFIVALKESPNRMYPHYIDKYSQKAMMPIDNLRVHKQKPFGFASDIGNITPNSNGGTMKDAINKINYGMGVVSTMMSTSNATFRLATKTKGISPYIYWSGKFFGNQYVTVYKISKLGKLAGFAGFGVGFILDGYGVIQYMKKPNAPDAVHPAKMGINTFMTAIGFTAWGTPASLLYGGLEAFYPRGASGALKDHGKAQKDYRKYNNGAVLKPML